jgi:hypothetical protein
MVYELKEERLMLDLKVDISFKRTYGGPVYNLKSNSHFLAITKDEVLIHGQTIYRKSEWGLKSLWDIIGDIPAYIDFCETYHPYAGISYETDEWAKHTKIELKERYRKPNGELVVHKYHFSSYPGEMSAYSADRYMDSLLSIIHDKKMLKSEPPVFKDIHELANYLNKQIREENEALERQWKEEQK